MAILKQQIAFSAKGSLAEREDWWWLCYDAETQRFFVEHEWHHMNPYKVGKEPANTGTSQHEVDSWQGEGAANIPDAKRALLEKAGA